MDVRTICLGLLTRGEATGYEIKKLFDEDGYQHFIEASFGSIYPALNQLTRDGLVEVRAEAQEKRPDRKVYSITPAGRSQFLASLLKPLSEDRHRSAFVFAMLFSHFLPEPRVTELLDNYVRQNEEKLAQLNKAAGQTRGEQFAIGLGQAIYTAMLDFVRKHRSDLESAQCPAAE
ncbi:MAG TPA: PadR family transcriptional regulator [Rhizomicrobium sp.]|nr:PadR family transcriptional regulator [Rhizomicrobium sp.]